MEITIYELAIIFISLYAIICYAFPYKKLSRKLFIILSSGHLLIIQGLRAASVGGDLIRYESNFNSAKSVPLGSFFSEGYEIGYEFYEHIIGRAGFSFHFFLFSISLFNLIILSIFIYKYSTHPYISYLFYIIIGIYDFGFSGIRQSIAMSIILISFKYLMEKKTWKFIGVVIIASLFHITSLIFIPIYLLTNTNFKSYYKKLYPLIFIIVLVFGFQISHLATIIFNEDLTRYLDFGINEFSTTALLLLFILLCGILFKHLNYQLKSNKLYNNLLIIISVSLLIQVLSTYSYLFTRLNMFFYQFVIILVPIIYDALIKKTVQRNKYGKFFIRFLINIVLFIILIIYFHYYLQNNPHDIIPHMFFWQA